MPKLIVNPGTEQSWEIPLPDGVTVLGSDPALDFVITHESVAPSHCEVTVTNGAVRLRDLGSSSGTFMNHELILEAAIPNGKRIHLGEVELELIDAETGAGDPPIPRRLPAGHGPATGPRTQSACCKYHPKAMATWHCGHCQASFCDLCINVRQTGGGVRHLCRKCGNDCAPVAVHYEEPVEENFYQMLPGVFRYPFTGSGTILLVAGTVLFAILNMMSYLGRFAGLLGIVAVLILAIFGGGYLFNYAKSIVVTSAQGGDLPPDWPDAGEWREEILEPCFQMIGLVLLAFGPAIVFSRWRPFGDEWAVILTVTFLALGALFAPMGMLLLAMFDSLAAFNPVPIVQSILRIPLPYLLAAGVFEMVIGAYYAVVLVAAWSGLPAVVTGIFTGFLELYAICVGMRVLGLLYRTHKSELGWFERP